VQEDGEGIAVCTVSHKATGKPLYCLITYVYPTLSARAVPQLKEFCETHRRSFSLVRVGPYHGDRMQTNACTMVALAFCWIDSGQPGVSAPGPGVLGRGAGGEGDHAASYAADPKLWTATHESSNRIREDVNPSALLDPQACTPRRRRAALRVVHSASRHAPLNTSARVPAALSWAEHAETPPSVVCPPPLVRKIRF
jgi:hypothetical protein